MIKVLSKNVADKIAAGEVVDRPLSIVKELVENAIDAGASNITVEIKNGGKTYIRVTDNGCGINENEVETAFLRHATSKITTDEDLNSIHTLGFRGEALASISAVSRVELITKTADAKTGTSLKIYGGEVFEKKATGCPDGTTIIVSDLFYNTPARLKFMKTDATESTLIIDFISKIALAYADIRIRLINNGTILFSTNGKGDRYSSIVTVYNKTVGDGLIHISASNDTMSLEGYISRPEFNKTNRRQQIFFVNGRVVTNKVMDIAVMEGYRERLFEGRYPIAYLFFSIKPELIDVNIHPNKKEVRFHQDMPVKEFIAQTIRNGLLSEESIPHVDEKAAMTKQLEKGNTNRKIEAVLKENKQTMQQEQKSQEQIDIKNILSTLAEERNKHSYSEANTSEKNGEMTLKESSGTPYTSQTVSKTDSCGINSGEIHHHKQMLPETASEHKTPAPNAEKKDNLFRRIKLTGTIFNTYITAVDADCFYLIDQHAAHERIFYEKLMRQYESEEKLSQTILTPIIADVPYSIKSSEDSWVHIIRSMGFDIEPFGAKSYIIKEIPAFMELSEAQNMVNYFLENINENIDIKNEARINKIIMKSCKSAVKANDVLSMAECQRLIDDLAECENPYSCPHGRPTFIKMTKYEVEKMFKRV